MKRAVAALVMLGIGTVMAAPTSAAVTVYGSAQLKYTVNATASVSIATNYDPASATGAQATGASSIIASTAGACSAGVAETTATLTFGGITPASAGYNACLYKNALSVGVLSNDTTGVKVYEYLDTLATGEQVCVFPTDLTLKAKPTGSAAATTTAYGAGCAPGGTALTGLGAASGGTAGTFGAAGAPGGTDVTATPQYTAFSGAPFQLFSGVASGTTFQFLGQDVQLNVSGAAASGNATNIITVAVIPQ